MIADARGNAGLEEFLARYPTHPFTASVLYALGRTEQLQQRFPKHPLARAVAAKSIVDEK